MLLSVALLVPTSGVPAATAATATGPTTTVGTELAAGSALAPRAPQRYTPPPGVKLNNPLSTRTRRVILTHLIKSINWTPRGEKIRILSWNIRSPAFVSALIRAHERGVSVRVLISEGNANAENPNPGFNRLKRALAKGSRAREDHMSSWGRRCDRSCRGRGGIPHTKLYLFSKVGDAHNVVMYGSANATDVAVRNQWNDLFTIVDRRGLYRNVRDIFLEMARDEVADRPVYREFTHHNVTLGFLPWAGGTAQGDPVLNELNKIRCTGAEAGSGRDGRTVVRIGQTAILDARGARIAERLKTMWNRGCDIRIVYGLMGREVLRIVRQPSGRGAIPIQQVAQDWQYDGIYDRYLHMKTMTVSGVYDGDRSAEVTFNGSANWTGLTLKSDDVVGRLFGERVRTRYSRWFDHLFRNPPPQASVLPAVAAGGEAAQLSASVGPRFHGIEW